MSVLFGVIKYILIVAVIGTMFYARGLYLELKSTKSKLKEAQCTIKYLEEELQKAYNRTER